MDCWPKPRSTARFVLEYLSIFTRRPNPQLGLIDWNKFKDKFLFVPIVGNKVKLLGG